MAQERYIVATVKPWHIAAFKRVIQKYPGSWHLVTDPRRLSPSFVKKVQPRFIFFPHWSWRVPKEILKMAECVCFHETAVPYGRGGSPIQNLITRGHKKTVISALRMEEGLDTGPVYLRKHLSLHGTAQEIYERSARIVTSMIRAIIRGQMKPLPQRGKIVVFTRRRHAQSNIATLRNPTLSTLYDHIRMLDAETYPRAYISIGTTLIEFSKPRMRRGRVEAVARIYSRRKPRV